MERHARCREGHPSDLIQERSATSSIVSRQPPLSGPWDAQEGQNSSRSSPMSKHHTSTRGLATFAQWGTPLQTVLVLPGGVTKTIPELHQGMPGAASPWPVRGSLGYLPTNETASHGFRYRSSRSCISFRPAAYYALNVDQSAE